MKYINKIRNGGLEMVFILGLVLGEWHRLMAKVDVFWARGDQLEASLTSDINARLFGSILNGVLGNKLEAAL